MSNNALYINSPSTSQSVEFDSTIASNNTSPLSDKVKGVEVPAMLGRAPISPASPSSERITSLYRSPSMTLMNDEDIITDSDVLTDTDNSNSDSVDRASISSKSSNSGSIPVRSRSSSLVLLTDSDITIEKESIDSQPVSSAMSTKIIADKTKDVAMKQMMKMIQDLQKALVAVKQQNEENQHKIKELESNQSQQKELIEELRLNQAEMQKVISILERETVPIGNFNPTEMFGSLPNGEYYASFAKAYCQELKNQYIGDMALASTRVKATLGAKSSVTALVAGADPTGISGSVVSGINGKQRVQSSHKRLETLSAVSVEYLSTQLATLVTQLPQTQRDIDYLVAISSIEFSSSSSSSFAELPHVEGPKRLKKTVKSGSQAIQLAAKIGTQAVQIAVGKSVFHNNIQRLATYRAREAHKMIKDVPIQSSSLDTLQVVFQNFVNKHHRHECTVVLEEHPTMTGSSSLYIQKTSGTDNDYELRQLIETGKSRSSSSSLRPASSSSSRSMAKSPPQTPPGPNIDAIKFASSSSSSSMAKSPPQTPPRPNIDAIKFASISSSIKAPKPPIPTSTKPSTVGSISSARPSSPPIKPKPKNIHELMRLQSSDTSSSGTESLTRGMGTRNLLNSGNVEKPLTKAKSRFKLSKPFKKK